MEKKTFLLEHVPCHNRDQTKATVTMTKATEPSGLRVRKSARPEVPTSRYGKYPGRSYRSKVGSLTTTPPHTRTRTRQPWSSLAASC